MIAVFIDNPYFYLYTFVSHQWIVKTIMINKICKCLVLFIALIFPSLLPAKKTYVRGQIFHLLTEPDLDKPDSYQWIEDGILIISDGKIEQIGTWENLNKNIPIFAEVIHYPDGLIMPGFIDTHTHYPQTDMIAANSGGDLLHWLNTYTFPFEEKFGDKAYAENTAHFFVEELLRNGTTTALIFTSTQPHTTDAIFFAAEKKNMRIIAGKVVTDRNVPAYLLESPEQAYISSEALINKWHHKPNTRLLYAITIRFAPTTSEKMFEKMMQLKQQYPDVYVHTHISETKDEVEWVKTLYPHEHYLAVYDYYHLLGRNTLLAHGIHLTDPEFKRIAATKTNLAFCPTSNLFLGSGLFDFNGAQQHGINIGLGTDVGAGTSFSQLQTMNEAYKVMQLQKQALSSLNAFYLATLGGAKALNLDDKLGNFLPGKEADFVVLNIQGATPLLKRRLAITEQLDDKLFVLMTLADDRSVVATYVAGQRVFTQQ